jgi:hypothetical protein
MRTAGVWMGRHVGFSREAMSDLALMYCKALISPCLDRFIDALGLWPNEYLREQLFLS